MPLNLPKFGWFVLVSLFSLWLTTGCGSVITIERLDTPPVNLSPLATPTTIATTADASLNQTPVRIVAPKIDLDAAVAVMDWITEERQGQVVSEWIVPEEAAGWHRNSAWPGQGSNVVISGHNASLGGQVFGQVEALEVGDIVTIITASDDSFHYQVQEKTIVRTLLSDQEALNFLRQSIAPTASERLTLITCWPSWTNTHRLVVVATPYVD